MKIQRVHYMMLRNPNIERGTHANLIEILYDFLSGLNFSIKNYNPQTFQFM